MKILLTFVFIISINGLLTSQLCPNLSTTSQTVLDNWVTANAGTCNVLNGLNLRADLDYSGLSFIDTIDGSLRITRSISDLNGLQNVKHAESIFIGGSYGVDLPNLQILDIKSVGSRIDFDQTTIPDLSFIDDVEIIPDLLRFRNVTFTNPFNLSLPNLENAGGIFIEINSGISDLNIFAGLNKASYVSIEDSQFTTIQPLQAIDTIQSLQLAYNLFLTHVDLQGFDHLRGLRLHDGVIISVTNLDVDTLNLDIINTQLTDLSFLNNVGSLQYLTLRNTQINTLSHLFNNPVTKGLALYENSSLENLQGLENVSALDFLQIDRNYSLLSIDELINLNSVKFGSSSRISNNPKLNQCCVLGVLKQLTPAQDTFKINMYGNKEPCDDVDVVIEKCTDEDQDGILDFSDNCPNNYNPLQNDNDGDGVGNQCDNCPNPITVQLSTQAEVDDFEMTITAGCIVENLYIEGDNNIFDLRPLSFLTSLPGTLGIIDCETLQSLDGLENLTEVGGSLQIFSNESMTNIDGLRNLKKIGELDISETNLLESIDALSSLDSIFGNVIVTNNTSLSYCCSLEPFISGDKYIQGTISLSPNLTGCNSTSEITTNCGDTDVDGILNIFDNCPSIYNQRQDDFDNDGIGDICDNCQKTYNPEQIDQDNDLAGDACDLCPTISGGNLDMNNNGIGDDCESLAGAESGFVGIGTPDPDAKIAVKDGDIYLDNIHRGVILKSADGSCFRLKVQNDGRIISDEIDCPDN